MAGLVQSSPDMTTQRRLEDEPETAPQQIPL
jgi:hypothetical protein